jgi:flagellin-like protein
MERAKAVSPTVGVVLMVAITVILVALVSAFISGAVPASSNAPQEIKVVNVTVTNVTYVPREFLNCEKYGVSFENGDRVMFGKNGNIDAVIGENVTPLSLAPGHSYSLAYQKGPSDFRWTLTGIKEIDK